MDLTKLIHGITGSWKTTLLAGVTALYLVLGEAKNLLDNDPNTIFDWNNFWTLGLLALVALLARDSDKSSEDVKIK